MVFHGTLHLPKFIPLWFFGTVHRDFSRKLASKFIEISVAHANCDDTVIERV